MKVHLAHFPGTHEDSVETLCGNPGMCTSNFPVVDCQNCRVICDWAMERGKLSEVRPAFWVVDGTPPRAPNKDERDDYEFWFYDAPPCRVLIRKEWTANDYMYPGEDVPHVYHSSSWELRYATDIPRPFIGREATAPVPAEDPTDPN